MDAQIRHGQLISTRALLLEARAKTLKDDYTIDCEQKNYGKKVFLLVLGILQHTVNTDKMSPSYFASLVSVRALLFVFILHQKRKLLYSWIYTKTSHVECTGTQLVHLLIFANLIFATSTKRKTIKMTKKKKRNKRKFCKSINKSCIGIVYFPCVSIFYIKSWGVQRSLWWLWDFFLFVKLFLFWYIIEIACSYIFHVYLTFN